VRVKSKETASAGKLEAPTSSQALAAYRSRDFGNAERLIRMDARSQSGKQMDKTIAFANQVRELKTLVDKAGGEESKNPQAAIKDYQSAMALDGRIARGMHAAFFKQHLGKLALPVAHQAFAQGKYDAAFAAVQQAQHAGVGDGGILKQLESKAKELTDRGASMQRSNLTQAKQYWRLVIRMVPPSSPSYARAYQLLNQGGGGHKDEDED
jgi:tetratricopeptide (TPR) repeat protein